MAGPLATILGSNLGEVIKDIIEAVHLDPTVKAQLEAKQVELQAAAEQADKDLDAHLNDIAGQNIRAEQSSGDKYVERARPSVVWAGIAFIGWNYCLVPTFGFHWHLTSLNLPDAFWWTWGTVVTGYVFNRTAEKIMQMPGDSNISLPLGIQLGQKSSNQ